MSEGVALSDLLAGMSNRGVPLASETGLFILLQTTEALRTAPATVNLESVHVTAEGDVQVRGAGKGDEKSSLASMGRLAGELLSPIPPGAKAMFERLRKSEVATFTALEAELQALLVPLNRGAARRVLGRLVREHAKPREGRSRTAADTHDEGASANADLIAENATASAVDTHPDSMPPIPPPPRLGDLASLPGAGGHSAVDTEPDGPLLQSATDTHPDGESTNTPAETSTDSLSPLAPRPRSNPLPWIVVALLVGAAAFFAWRFYENDGERPAAHGQR